MDSNREEDWTLNARVMPDQPGHRRAGAGAGGRRDSFAQRGAQAVAPDGLAGLSQLSWSPMHATNTPGEMREALMKSFAGEDGEENNASGSALQSPTNQLSRATMLSKGSA